MIQRSQLRLVFESGMTEDGKPLYKNKNYSNIKPTATESSLFSVAQALASLQSASLAHVQRTDFHVLGE
ncbi:DUF1659 domain-containing protein [Thermolongibacillus altinsuensis]|jgi:hypothetical protein|uniref:DUF1659 domain-containing protein n=1 Tax=Thermolongibacillus altinsuensis TaxID=575256 RepID=UPI00242A2AEE|nr:DUF1659 domain-containing protein [Thermolongibacillus altinsuensis]GMB08671.1 hypothetical protein B1no1_13810 [Thermolongibacillus altinsuensis]